MASTISAGTSAGTAIAIAGDTSGALALQTNNGTTAVTVDTSQKVGIGTSSPSAKLHVSQVGNPIAQFTRSDSGTGLVIASDSDGPYFRPETSSAIRFNNSANSAEYMRVDSSGNLLVGCTSFSQSSSVKGFGVRGSDGLTSMSRTGDSLALDMYHSADGQMIRFNNTGNTAVGNIQVNSTTTNYNTSSDYRLKENVAPMTGALDKVNQLKPVTYKWKSTGEESQGFIAHELAEIVPDCVNGEKDAVDEENKPVYQGIDTSFLVATLTAAIQELNAKVDAQATTIAELQAKVG